MKPKEIAIIAETSLKDDKRIQHREQGVWWFNSFGDLKDHQTHGLSPATFNIIVIDKNTYKKDKEKINSHSHLLPYRVIIVDQDKNSGSCTELPGASKGQINWNKVKNNEANKIISDFWDKWVAWLMDKNGYKNSRIDLFLQQKMNETETSKWKEKAIKWENDGKAIKLSIISIDDNRNIIPEVEKDNSHFVYDRHFKGYKKLKDTANFVIKPPAFHEAFDKGSSDFVPIFASSPTSKMIYKLGEAASLRVVIIDERVAEVAYTSMIRDEEYSAMQVYGRGFKRLDVAKWSNIFIATHLKINEESPVCVHYSTKNKTPRVCVRCKTFSDPITDISQVNEFKVYWCTSENCSDCSTAEEIQPAPNALIMHQGITEGLLKKAILCNNKTETFRKVLTTFLNDLKKHIPYVVIASGRGIPANLPETAKFLPFSLIEDYLMKDRMAKFSLTRVLMNIIRGKE